MHHSFDIAHAEQYGIAEAVLISNFQFWIAKNKANYENQHQGRTWTYNSVRAFAALFPYLSRDQVRRAIDRLVKQDVLVVGNFNELPTDQTKWFAFKDESAFVPMISHLADLPTGSGKSASPIGKSANSLIKTDVNTDVNLEPPSTKKPSKGSRLTQDWVLPKSYGDWALAEYPGWSVEFIRQRGVTFRRHWSAVPGKDGLKLDWLATWQNFCLKEFEYQERMARPSGTTGGGSPWWASDQSILAEGSRRGLSPRAGEIMFVFKGRVQAAIDDEGKPPAPVTPPASTVAIPKEPIKVQATAESKAARDAEIKKALALAKQGSNGVSQ